MWNWPSLLTSSRGPSSRCGLLSSSLLSGLLSVTLSTTAVKHHITNTNALEIAKFLRIELTEQCFTSQPTQYRLHGRLFLQVKRPNQQYQSTEGTYSTQTNQTHNKQKWTQNTASPLVYNNMGWVGDGSHRGQGCQAWTAVGLPPR